MLLSFGGYAQMIPITGGLNEQGNRKNQMARSRQSPFRHDTRAGLLIFGSPFSNIRGVAF